MSRAVARVRWYAPAVVCPSSADSPGRWLSESCLTVCQHLPLVQLLSLQPDSTVQLPLQGFLCNESILWLPKTLVGALGGFLHMVCHTRGPGSTSSTTNRREIH